MKQDRYRFASGRLSNGTDGCGGSKTLAWRGTRLGFRAIAVLWSAAIAATIILPACARAQSGVELGPGAAYEFGLQLGLNRVPGAVDWCACNGHGSSYNHTVWAGASLRGLFSGPFDLAERMNVGYSIGRFTSDIYDDTAAAGHRDRFIVNGKAFYVSEDLLALWHVPAGLALEFGPSVTYRVNGIYTQSEQIVEPADATFPVSGTPQRELRSGDILADARLQVALLAGASYGMPLSGTLRLLPALHARISLEGLRLGLGLQAVSLNAGFTLLVNVNGAENEQMDTHLEPGPPHPVPFRASVDIYAYDSTGLRAKMFTVRRRNMRHTQRALLPSVIAFSRNSALVSERYLLLNRSQAQTFSIDSLVRIDPFRMVGQSLNVVGMRMRNNPQAVLALAGMRAPAEAPGIAHARALAVRSYLEETWGVDAGRIVIGGDPAAIGHDSIAGVQLSSQWPGLFAPVETVWDEQQIDAPQIGLKPQFTGGMGMRSWEITVRRNGNEVAHASSDGSVRSYDMNLGLGDEGAAVPPAPLVAVLTAEDSSGALVAARDTLPVQVAPTAAVDSRQWAAYGITIGDSGSMRDAAAMLAAIETTVQSGDHVLIQHPPGMETARTGAQLLADRLTERGAIVRIEQAEADRVDGGHPAGGHPAGGHPAGGHPAGSVAVNMLAVTVESGRR
ncbi:MAG: hypothetical protein JST22_19780 [Bacteroidetes bacterium]|nr:hypothetical protein [Bacteroidota bacterium]